MKYVVGQSTGSHKQPKFNTSVLGIEVTAFADGFDLEITFKRHLEVLLCEPL